MRDATHCQEFHLTCSLAFAWRYAQMDIYYGNNGAMTKNKAAAALGRLGGKARAVKLSKEQRSESARRAAQARWTKSKKKTNPQQ